MDVFGIAGLAFGLIAFSTASSNGAQLKRLNLELEELRQRLGYVGSEED